MILFILVTHYVKSGYFRAVIVNSSSKKLGSATCKNCPRVAANAAVAKTFGLNAANLITEITAPDARSGPPFYPRTRKLRDPNINYFYQFTYIPENCKISNSTES